MLHNACSSKISRDRSNRYGHRSLLTAFGLLLGGAHAGCAGADPSDLETTASTTSPMYFLSTGRWPSKLINVCYETAGFDTQKAWLKEVIKGQRSWEEAGKVDFVGFGACASGATGIRITLDKFAQTDVLGAENGGTVKLQLPVGTKLTGYCNIAAPPPQTFTDEQCFRKLVLHEFGHAIGISHEHNRSDKPTTCMAVAPDGERGDTKWGQFDAVSIMENYGAGCRSSEPLNLSALDRTGIARFYGERDGDPQRLGYYNGDHRADLLCHDTVHGAKWVAFMGSNGQFDPNSFSTAAPWCNHDTGKLHKGDFNHDGRTDLLCHDVASGHEWIDLASSTGHFDGTDGVITGDWCGHATGELHVGDFNGDGFDDLLCLDVVSGKKWIDYADIFWGSFTGFSGTNWTKTRAWCNQPYQHLYVGNFDGVGGDDLLCRDVTTGQISIDYSGDGLDSPGAWMGGEDYCTSPSNELLIGDFDGDGADDVLCHDMTAGYRKIDYAKNGFGVLDWGVTNAWCTSGEGRLYVGDMNNDYRDDLLCHQIRTGDKWVDYASTTGTFPGVVASQLAGWCGHDSGVLR